MIGRLLMTAFILLSFSEPGISPEQIQWDATRRLNWTDFKAMPPENAGNAALTSSGILMSFTTNGETFHYELSCNFDQSKSWGRVKNEYILSHEQGHFDIAELYTRKLNKSLKAYRYQPGSFNKDINTIYRNTMKELKDTQDQYDEQTDHSRNVTQQKNWLAKIDNSLRQLQAFSGYK